MAYHNMGFWMRIIFFNFLEKGVEMVTTVALTIIGCVLILFGIIFNLIQKQINQKLMGDLTEKASPVSWTADYHNVSFTGVYSSGIVSS